MKRSEFIVASAQQQKAIACFTAFSSQRHLVLLTGAAGTGKTVVALQVANNLVQELEVDAEPGKGPLLVATADYSFEKNPLLNFLDVNTSSAKTKLHDTLKQITGDYGVSESEEMLKDLCRALTQQWKGRPIVVLIDEIIKPEMMLNSLA